MLVVVPAVVQHLILVLRQFRELLILNLVVEEWTLL
jgi:hypothetical protein